MKQKYGAFPLFWQDLKGWEHWEEVRKTYMIDTEETTGEGVVDVDTPAAADNSEDIAAIAEAAEVAPTIKALMGELDAGENTPAVVETEASIVAVRMNLWAYVT